MHAFDMSIPGPIWVDTEHQARQWIDRFLLTHRRNGGLGLDTETTGLNKFKDWVVIWSLSDGESRICLDRKFLGLFKEPILENPDIAFDFTNAKFDAHMLANSGIEVVKAGPWRDTSVMSWLRNENNQGRHGLKECVTDYIGRVTPTFEQTFGRIPPARKGMVRKTIGHIIRETLERGGEDFIRAVDYASLDAYNSTMLRHFFDDLLASESIGWGTLYDYYYRVEVPFSKVLWKMERRGIQLDAGYLRSKEPDMQARMQSIRREFVHEMGDMINLNSPAHLRRFFFERLGKTSLKQTKGGKSGIRRDSTDVEVLETWAGQGDHWANLLLDYRSIAKTYGTYIEGLQEWLDPSYFLHTSLNQHGTVTGRLSSNDPNLQNITRADEDEFVIREAFIGGEGKKLLVADYEQLEMRLMAHFSRDEKMISEIHKGTDLHCYTTSEIEGVPYDDVYAAKQVKDKKDLTPRQMELLLKRQCNKSTGFGIIYGIGGPKLAHKLTRETKQIISEQEGWQLIHKWLNVFPGVQDYIESTKYELRRQGYVQVITGRKRRFGDINNMSRKDAAQAERQAVNAVIQGTAAEIAKMAMLAAENDPELKRLGAEMLLQVHDELLWKIPDDPEVGEACTKRVKEIMEHPLSVELLVPLPITVGIAESWAQAK